MNPTQGDVHVNRPLGSISIAYAQRADAFVADQVFPNIPVASASDSYFTYDKGDFQRDEMRERAVGTESAGGAYGNGTDSYAVRTHSFHKDVPDRIRRNADNPLNPDRDAAVFVTQKALLRRESLWVSNYFTTGKWATDITGVAATPTAGQTLHWSDAASTPVEDVATAKETILGSTGFDPNTMVVGYQVWNKLKNHPDIVDRVKYSGGVGPNNPAVVTTQAVAALFEVERLLVMKAVKNTADRGQTATSSFIGGKAAMLCYSAPQPAVMMPSAGYTFSWTGGVGNTQMGWRIKTFRMDHLDSDRVEIEMDIDQKLVATDLGYFWTTIVA